jgi:hypothetical protein
VKTTQKHYFRQKIDKFMKTLLTVNTNVQLTFGQLAALAKQLPKKQKAKLVSILVNESEEEEEEMTKAELVARIREGLEEVKLYKQGKITFQSAEDLLNEL